MTLIGVVITLVVVGVVLWIISLIPIPEPIRKIIYVVVILFVVLWLLQQFGLIGGPSLKLK